MTVDNPNWGAGSGDAHAATKPTHLALAPMRRSMLALLITYILQAHAASLGAGADDYITKPFTIADLVGRIDALLKVNE